VIASTPLAAVQAAVQDTGIATDAAVLALFNECISLLAARYRLEALASEDEAVIDAGTTWTDLPTDYSQGLSIVNNLTSGRSVAVTHSIDQFEELPAGGVTTGQVTNCIPLNGRLLVFPSPTVEETLSFWYFRTPVALALATDTIDGLPEDLAGLLLQAYACRELFGLIEDGADGRKPQTAWWGSRYDKAEAALKHRIFMQSPTAPDTRWRP